MIPAPHGAQAAGAAAMPAVPVPVPGSHAQPAATQGTGYDGLLTLGHAAEHAEGQQDPAVAGAATLASALPAAHPVEQQPASDAGVPEGHHAAHGMFAAPPVIEGNGFAEEKKKRRQESLQLNLNEDEVIAELYARGLVEQQPVGSPKKFTGGRPPLGMGPYKRIKQACA